MWQLLGGNVTGNEVMIDPNAHRALCEQYLSRFLGKRVDFIQAEKLTISAREAPWRLDVRVDGDAKSYVLQLDLRGFEYEYKVLKAVEAVMVPTL